MKLKILFLFLVIFYSFFNYTSLAHEPDNGGDYFTLHMQEILVELGCLDKATGVNDDQSVDAIKDFQKEAENVVLLTDLTQNTMKGYERDPDDENRLFYVGATRTKENLHIIEPRKYEKGYIL